jgi:hypothetical protein
LSYAADPANLELALERIRTWVSSLAAVV